MHTTDSHYALYVLRLQAIPFLSPALTRKRDLRRSAPEEVSQTSRQNLIAELDTEKHV
jgi:hypothetical protein